MGLFRNLFMKGGNDNEIIVSELKDKVAGLEKILQSDFPLLGVDGDNYITYNTSKSNYFNTNYTVNRAITLLSNNIAALPLKLYRGEQELPLDFTFPNGFSIIKPNTNMSLNELLYTTCIYYFFRGEFCQHIIDDGVFRLIPINPKNLTRNQDGSWKLNKRNRITIIQKEELIYTAFLNPEISTWTSNVNRGLSPVDVVKAELKNDEAACNYSTKYFENFAKIGGVLTDKEGSITSEEMNRLVTQFNSAHQNQSRAYKTLGLPKGISYEDVSQTLKEMDFLSSRKDIRDKILIVLGVHPALLGITETVNRSVAEEAGRQMWSQTLRPAAVRIQEKLNQQLFNIYFPGYFVKFDFSEIKELQENMESILKQAVEFKKLGFSTNEINKHFKLGMEPIKDEIGDMRFVPIYLKPLEAVMLPPLKAGTTPAPKKAVDKLVELLEKDEGIPISKGESYQQTYLRKKKPIELKFTSKIKRHFFEQRAEVLSVVNNSKHMHNITNDLNKLFNDENPKLQKTIEPLYIQGAEAGIDLVASQLKIVTGMVSKVPVESIGMVDEAIIVARTNKIVGINHTVYNQIKMSMWENLRDGGTIQELSKEIKNIYNFAGTRSTTIARTETGGVINESSMSEYRKRGVERKRWVGGTADKRNHAATNGTIIPINEAFQMADGSSLMFPGDPNGGVAAVVNCRCCLSAVISEGE